MLTQKRLKEILHYDSDTGIWVWLIISAKRIQIGDIAGYINNDGYRIIGIGDRQYLSSRLAWLYVEGYFPENMIDHKDRIRNNDKWKNLRHVTRSCNGINRKVQLNNTSGITGVYKVKKKWYAKIRIANKLINIGSFDHKIDAAKARLEYEKKYNYIKCNSASSAYLYLKEMRKGD